VVSPLDDSDDEASIECREPVTHTVAVGDFECAPTALEAWVGDRVEFLWSAKDRAFAGLDFQFSLRREGKEIERSTELNKSSGHQSWTSAPLPIVGEVEFLEVIHGVHCMRGSIMVAAKVAEGGAAGKKKSRKNKKKRRKKRAKKRRTGKTASSGTAEVDFPEPAMGEEGARGMVVYGLAGLAAAAANSAPLHFQEDMCGTGTLHRVVVKLNGFEPNCLDLVIGDSVEWVCEEACGGVRLRCEDFDMESPTLNTGDVWRCSFDEKTMGLKLERSGSVQVHVENLVFPRRCTVLITSRSAYESTSSSFYDSDDHFSDGDSSVSVDGDSFVAPSSPSPPPPHIPTRGMYQEASSLLRPLPRPLPLPSTPGLVGSFGLPRSNAGPSMQDLIAGAAKLPSTAVGAGEGIDALDSPLGPVRAAGASEADTESSSFDSESGRDDSLGSEGEEEKQGVLTRPTGPDSHDQVARPALGAGGKAADAQPLRGSFWPGNGRDGESGNTEAAKVGRNEVQQGEAVQESELQEEEEEEQVGDEEVWVEAKSSSRRRRRRQAAKARQATTERECSQVDQAEAENVKVQLQELDETSVQDKRSSVLPSGGAAEQNEAKLKNVALDSGEALFAFLKGHPLSQSTTLKEAPTTQPSPSPEGSPRKPASDDTPERPAAAQAHPTLHSAVASRASPPPLPPNEIRKSVQISRREKHVQRFFRKRFEKVSERLTSMVDEYPGGSRAPILIIDADGTWRGHPMALRCMGLT